MKYANQESTFDSAVSMCPYSSRLRDCTSSTSAREKRSLSSSRDILDIDDVLKTRDAEVPET